MDFKTILVLFNVCVFLFLVVIFNKHRPLINDAPRHWTIKKRCGTSSEETQ